jgi:hypothetical protein
VSKTGLVNAVSLFVNQYESTLLPGYQRKGDQMIPLVHLIEMLTAALHLAEAILRLANGFLT